jgi:hypothetical protein
MITTSAPRPSTIVSPQCDSDVPPTIDTPDDEQIRKINVDMKMEIPVCNRSVMVFDKSKSAPPTLVSLYC